MGSENSVVEVGKYKVILCVMMSCVAWHCSIQAFVAHCCYGKQALRISHLIGVDVFFLVILVSPPPPQNPGGFFCFLYFFSFFWGV